VLGHRRILSVQAAQVGWNIPGVGSRGFSMRGLLKFLALRTRMGLLALASAAHRGSSHEQGSRIGSQGKNV